MNSILIGLSVIGFVILAIVGFGWFSSTPADPSDLFGIMGASSALFAAGHIAWRAP